MDTNRLVDLAWHYTRKIARFAALIPLRAFEAFTELDTAYSPILPAPTPTKAELAEDRAYIFRHTDPASPESRRYIEYLAAFPELPCWLWISVWPQNRALIDISAMPMPTQTWLLTLTEKEQALLTEAGPSTTIAHARGEEVVPGVRQPRQYRPRAKKLTARVIDNEVSDRQPGRDLSADFVSCGYRP